jgi:hypothetical protein
MSLDSPKRSVFSQFNIYKAIIKFYICKHTRQTLFRFSGQQFSRIRDQFTVNLPALGTADCRLYSIDKIVLFISFSTKSVVIPLIMDIKKPAKAGCNYLFLPLL